MHTLVLSLALQLAADNAADAIRARNYEVTFSDMFEYLQQGQDSMSVHLTWPTAGPEQGLRALQCLDPVRDAEGN